MVAPHLGASGVELIPIGSGDDCFALAAGEQIVRVARHPRASRSLRREASVLERVGGRLEATVPRPEVQRLQDGPCFSVHERLDGDVVTRESWRAAIAQGERSWSRLVGRFLRSLHDVPLSELDACKLQRRSLQMEGTRLRHRGLEILRDQLSREARTHLWMLLAECSERSPSQSCLVHGDIAPGHLLVEARSEEPDTKSPSTEEAEGRPPVDEAQSRLGVIDFGDVFIAEPARDFVHLYEDFGPMVMFDVLEFYEPDDPNRFLQDMRGWYLVEALDWTLDGLVLEDHRRVREGVRSLIDDLGRTVWPFPSSET